MPDKVTLQASHLRVKKYDQNGTSRGSVVVLWVVVHEKAKINAGDPMQVKRKLFVLRQCNAKGTAKSRNTKSTMVALRVVELRPNKSLKAVEWWFMETKENVLLLG